MAFSVNMFFVNKGNKDILGTQNSLVIKKNISYSSNNNMIWYYFSNLPI